MSYLHLLPHISVTRFKDSTIVLDLKQDRYFVFDEEKASLLDLILQSKWAIGDDGDSFLNDQTNDNTEFCSEFLQVLLEHNFIGPDLFEKPYQPIKDNHAEGVEEIDWQLPLDKYKRAKISWQVIKAFYTLVRVHLVVKFRGFYGLIQLVRKAHNPKAIYTAPDQAKLEELVSLINQACLLYPTRTKCLEWAATLVIIGQRLGFSLTINIGVQNYPFLAHAWVQNGQQVIADSQYLPHNMAVILSAPN